MDPLPWHGFLDGQLERVTVPRSELPPDPDQQARPGALDENVRDPEVVDEPGDPCVVAIPAD